MSILISVDLPAPLRPRKPYTQPVGTRKLTVFDDAARAVILRQPLDDNRVAHANRTLERRGSRRRSGLGPGELPGCARRSTRPTRRRCSPAARPRPTADRPALAVARDGHVWNWLRRLGNEHSQPWPGVQHSLRALALYKPGPRCWDSRPAPATTRERWVVARFGRNCPRAMPAAI